MNELVVCEYCGSRVPDTGKCKSCGATLPAPRKTPYESWMTSGSRAWDSVPATWAPTSMSIMGVADGSDTWDVERASNYHLSPMAGGPMYDVAGNLRGSHEGEPLPPPVGHSDRHKGLLDRLGDAWQKVAGA